ncbi:MAG: iron-sulfur cluster repair protein YtfE [Alphaproteobacteria bacterium]|nr:iron-sulfur cluster repair protein YtfE [Alphaproteobacteria bacterium]
MSLQNQSLGEIASNIPGATRLFREHQIDFCCGGARSLKEETERRGVAIEPLLAALNQLKENTATEKNWKDAQPEALIAHILQRFHMRHREQLPELIQLSEKVERVHAENPDCPEGLAAHLKDMQEELLCHMVKEEQVLFPMLLQGMRRAASAPIAVMEEEHKQHGEALEKMLSLAHQLVLPERACNSWRALYLGLDELRNDLMEHIHLENNILFKSRKTDSGQGCGGKCSCGG